MLCDLAQFIAIGWIITYDSIYWRYETADYVKIWSFEFAQRQWDVTVIYDTDSIKRKNVSFKKIAKDIFTEIRAS